MGIWAYDDAVVNAPDYLRLARVCPYCSGNRPSIPLLRKLGAIPLPRHLDVWAVVDVCDVCGWWRVSVDHVEYTGAAGMLQGNFVSTISGYASGSLRNLDPSNPTLPLDELNRFLMVRSERLGEVRPRVVEETVASVYKGLGYAVRLTATSRDGGIDIFVLDNTGGGEIGIQVKRHRDRVGVEYIRSFLGALVVHGLTHGVVVSTSGYTRDARRFADSAGNRGIEMELRDAGWLLDALRIVQRRPYDRLSDPNAPFARIVQDPNLLRISEECHEDKTAWP
ncbi:MAG: restriction endonuclease [Planctomycetota bacterium]|nr:restriction endonuclease [Planctomycetota bacterium]